MAETICRSLRDGALEGEHAAALTIKDSVYSPFGPIVFNHLLTQLSSFILAGKSQSRGLVLITLTQSPSFYADLLKTNGIDVASSHKWLRVLDCYTDPLGWNDQLAECGSISNSSPSMLLTSSLCKDVTNLDKLFSLILELGKGVIREEKCHFSVAMDSISEMLRHTSMASVAGFLSNLRSHGEISSVFWLLHEDLHESKTSAALEYMSSMLATIEPMTQLANGLIRESAENITLTEQNFNKGKFNTRFKRRNGRVRVVCEEFSVDQSGIKFKSFSSEDAVAQSIVPKLQFNLQLLEKEKNDMAKVVLPFEHQDMNMEEDKEVSSFKKLGVCEQLLEACDNLGWKTPSKIQALVLPHAFEGKDLIGLAQTGSGKTGAFAIPILQSLLENPQAFYACVLSPTRELAIQIAEQFEALGSGIGVKCTVLVGGVDQVQQSISLGKRPHIIFATPGRLVDHLSNTKGFSLRTLKYLVLDEADRLLNEDFEKVLDDILSAIPRERKTYLYSATMTKKVQKLQRACLRNPVKIEAASKYSTVDTLKQQYRFVPAKYKDCYLIYILTEMSGSTSMVFTRTCEATRFLALVLRNLGFRAIPISGQMTQAKRLGSLNKFKAGECNILICTDVASRGLDIPSVDMVINYDIPTNSKDYIHRVGRTARAGRSGVAISLVNQYELEWYLQIEKLIGKKLPEFEAQEEEVLLLSERVSEAKRISIMKIKEEGGNKRRRGGEDEEEIQKYVGSNKNGKFSKKMKRK